MIGYKFNPGFQSDSEAIESFVVRHKQLELLLETIRENHGPSNRHLLVVAPRGAGKTTLVRRVLAEVRTNTEFSRAWYPIVFAEESYNVSSPGEFWLECVFHLFDQTSQDAIGETYKELVAESSEFRLRERSLSVLHSYAEARQVRLLIIVENLNMMFGEQMDKSAGWDLRHALQHDTTFMLLATAVSRFNEIDDPNQALFDQFETVDLKPLTLSECQRLWRYVAGEPLTPKKIRPLQILTGGNPRLIRILAEFSKDLAVPGLLQKLNHLIDQNTEFFKSQLDKLPAVERKVFTTLLDRWDPATTREIAIAARLELRLASAMITRLQKRGAIIKVSAGGKTAAYQAAERLFNIYYLMRRRSHPSNRVKALVSFMTHYYEGDRLIATTARIAHEACRVEPSLRSDYYWAYRGILEKAGSGVRDQILSLTPTEFIEGYSTSVSLADMWAQKPNSRPHEYGELGQTATDGAAHFAGLDDVNQLLAQSRAALRAKNYDTAELIARKIIEIDKSAAAAWTLLARAIEQKSAPEGEVEHAYKKALELDNGSGDTRIRYGTFLQKEGRHEEARPLLEQGLKQFPDSKTGWAALGQVLHELGDYDGAYSAFGQTTRLSPEDPWGWLAKGEIVWNHKGDLATGEMNLRRATEIAPDMPVAWEMLAGIVEAQDRLSEAEGYYRKAIDLDGSRAKAWYRWAVFLFRKLSRLDEAERAFKRSTELSPDLAAAWAGYAELLQTRTEGTKETTLLAEAESAIRTAIKLAPDVASGWATLGSIQRLAHDLSGAEESFRKAVELSPKFARGWFGLGELYYELHRIPEAEQAFRHAVEVGKGRKYPCRLPNQLGTLLFRERMQIDEAETFLLDAINRNPNCVCSMIELGRLYETTGRRENAEEYYRKAISTAPKMIQAYLSLGRMLARSSDRKDEARALLEHALAEEPNSPDAYLGLGYYFDVLEKNVEAQEYFRKAIEHEKPGARSAGRLYLARSLRKSGASFDEIAELYREALARPNVPASAFSEYMKFLLTDNSARETRVSRVVDLVEKYAQTLDSLNEAAWEVHKLKRQELYAHAQVWAQRALASDPQNAMVRHTVISLLLDRDHFPEALSLLPPLIEAAASDKPLVSGTIDVCVALARAGYTDELNHILDREDAKRALEPLVYAIRIASGDSVLVAQEILEVAKDIVDRIRMTKDLEDAGPDRESS